MRTRFAKRAAAVLRRSPPADPYDVHAREREGRREFFYDAFKALRFNGIDGDYAEFGSWGGLTFALAYQESRRHGHRAHLWAFDSFQGFPSSEESRDVHPEWVEGRMAMSLEQFRAKCAANGIPGDAYTTIAGFYDDTLAQMPETAAPTNVALAYVDCDLYSSTRTVLSFLASRLKHGMIVAFDDYFCWTATEISGERRAFVEFLGAGERWEWVPYRPIGWHGASFVLEDRALHR